MKKTLLTVMSVVIAIALVVCMLTVFVGCKDNDKSGSEFKALNTNATKTDTVVDGEAFGTAVAKADLKIGLICLHGTTSTYDKNFIDSMNAARVQLGLEEAQVVISTGIDESNDCYEEAKRLVAAGCNLIFADSFGHEDYLIKAAREYPNVQFCHATGTQAHTEGLANFHNAFASIYEGRYLAGVVAGLKLKEMIAAGKATATSKVGYVGAFQYAEVISGYTSWFLGLRSVEGCENITMEVTFTGSWYDPEAEETAAKTLIGRGCVLISQHADSMGAPGACEEAKVPNVSYNGSTFEACPNTFLVSSRIDWTPYYVYAAQCVMAGKNIATDWCGTIATGSVKLTDLGTACAEGTATKVAAVQAQLVAGTLKVFDTNKFTVGGKKLTEYGADIDSDAKFAPDTNAVVGDAFLESIGRSAPYFNVAIDGITVLED